jgi:hypothetical protein
MAGKRITDLDQSTIEERKEDGYIAVANSDTSYKIPLSDFPEVALSGDYEDLENKPDIPDAQIQSDWNQTDESAVDFIKNKPMTLNSKIGATEWTKGTINYNPILSVKFPDGNYKRSRFVLLAHPDNNGDGPDEIIDVYLGIDTDPTVLGYHSVYYLSNGENKVQLNSIKNTQFFKFGYTWDSSNNTATLWIKCVVDSNGNRKKTFYLLSAAGELKNVNYHPQTATSTTAPTGFTDIDLFLYGSNTKKSRGYQCIGTFTSSPNNNRDSHYAGAIIAFVSRDGSDLDKAGFIYLRKGKYTADGSTYYDQTSKVVIDSCTNNGNQIGIQFYEEIGNSLDYSIKLWVKNAGSFPVTYSIVDPGSMVFSPSTATSDTQPEGSVRIPQYVNVKKKESDNDNHSINNAVGSTNTPVYVKETGDVAPISQSLPKSLGGTGRTDGYLDGIRHANIDSGKVLQFQINPGQNHRSSNITIFGGNSQYTFIVTIGFTFLYSPNSGESAGFDKVPTVHAVECNNNTSNSYIPTVKYKYDSTAKIGYIYCQWAGIKRVSYIISSYRPSDITDSIIESSDIPSDAISGGKGHGNPHLVEYNQAVGSETTPVFVAASGEVKAMTGKLPSSLGGSDNNYTTADKNKVTSAIQPGDLGTAAYKNVPASGNASTTQVVMGNDTRLSNARPASDVSAWAKASKKPTYTASEVGAAASSHSHGNIANNGKSTNEPTSTTKYLRADGSWQVPPKSLQYWSGGSTPIKGVCIGTCNLQKGWNGWITGTMSLTNYHNCIPNAPKGKGIALGCFYLWAYRDGNAITASCHLYSLNARHTNTDLMLVYKKDTSDATTYKVSFYVCFGSGTSDGGTSTNQRPFGLGINYLENHNADIPSSLTGITDNIQYDDGYFSIYKMPYLEQNVAGVGKSNKPVYVKDNGEIAACGQLSLPSGGSDSQPIYIDSNGNVQACNVFYV